MNALIYIAEKYAQLEGLLVNRYGAQGIGLGNYAQSLKKRLPEQILSKISEFAEFRNSLFHYHKKVEVPPPDPASTARKELFNIQRKVDYILKACSYPEVVLARIDVAFKELEEARSKITTLMDSFDIQGNTLEEKLDKVENELSVETLWKLCQFRDYCERAENDDFAAALRYSQQTQNLYDEITKDLKDKNASPNEILPQERYTTDKINDDAKLIDEIHQKLLLLLGTNLKAPTCNMQTVLKRVYKIVDTTFTQTLLSETVENQSCVSTLIPTPKPLPQKQIIENLRVSLTNSLGARLHLKGKNLQEKIENGKSVIPSSLLSKIDQFDKSLERAVQNGEIDEKRLEEQLQKLDNDISSVAVETISPQDNSTKLPSQPTPQTSLKRASSTELETVKNMKREMFELLGAQVHCAGKTLRNKIDSLRNKIDSLIQEKDVSTSVILKLDLFETETDEVLNHNFIKLDAVSKLQELDHEIRQLLQPAIDAIRKKKRFCPKEVKSRAYRPKRNALTRYRGVFMTTPKARKIRKRRFNSIISHGVSSPL